MTKKSSEKHKRRSSKRKLDSTAAQHDLLRYAAMGKAKKLQKLLKAQPQLDLDATDAIGDTALHHACRGNHIAVARLLLRRVLSYLLNLSNQIKSMASWLITSMGVDVERAVRMQGRRGY